MKTRLSRLTKPRIFLLLMVFAGLVALLPVSWTDWAGGILQPFGWLQWSAASAVRTTGNVLRDAQSPSLEPEQAQALRDELDRLERRLGQQALLLSELERQLAEVTGIREELGDTRTRIIRAAVVGTSASPRRETLTIATGSLNGTGVRRGQWVAAGMPRAAEDPQATGRDVLLRQWLIGRIIKVYPYLSEVQLLADPGVERQPVRVAKVLPDGQWQTADEPCLLRGLGSGRMQIRQAKADYLASGHIMVLSSPSADLPVPLSIGIITTSSRAAESPLWYNLQVEPWEDPRKLDHVYVIAVGS